MSKERELLKEVLFALNGSSVTLIKLVIKEVEELLAQPEQEQEPISDDYAKLKEDYKHYISQKSQKREPLSDVNILCLNLALVAIVLWFC